MKGSRKTGNVKCTYLRCCPDSCSLHPGIDKKSISAINPHECVGAVSRAFSVRISIKLKELDIPNKFYFAILQVFPGFKEFRKADFSSIPKMTGPRRIASSC